MRTHRSDERPAGSSHTGVISAGRGKNLVICGKPSAAREADRDERMEQKMYESRATGGVRRALLVAGAGLGVALLSAGVAGAAGPVQLKSRMGNW